MACNVDSPLPPAGNSCEYSLSIRIDVIAFLSSRCVPIIMSSLRQLEWEQINYWLLHIIKHLWFGSHWRGGSVFFTIYSVVMHSIFIFSCKTENEKIQPVVVVTVAPKPPICSDYCFLILPTHFSILCPQRPWLLALKQVGISAAVLGLGFVFRRASSFVWGIRDRPLVLWFEFVWGGKLEGVDVSHMWISTLLAYVIVRRLVLHWTAAMLGASASFS